MIQGGLGAQPAAASRRCALGVSCLGVSSGLVGTIYTQFNSGFMKNPYFEKVADFSSVHVDMWWIGPMWPKCAFGDKKGLIWGKGMPFGNLPHHWRRNCELFENIILHTQ